MSLTRSSRQLCHHGPAASAPVAVCIQRVLSLPPTRRRQRRVRTGLAAPLPSAGATMHPAPPHVPMASHTPLPLALARPTLEVVAAVSAPWCYSVPRPYYPRCHPLERAPARSHPPLPPPAALEAPSLLHLLLLQLPLLPLLLATPVVRLRNNGTRLVLYLCHINYCTSSMRTAASYAPKHGAVTAATSPARQQDLQDLQQEAARRSGGERRRRGGEFKKRRQRLRMTPTPS